MAHLKDWTLDEQLAPLLVREVQNPNVVVHGGPTRELGKETLMGQAI